MSTTPPKIAVIGGGPGGMFFCHALESYRRELEKKGDDDCILPDVTCFERASGPGGVWRSSRAFAATDYGDSEENRLPPEAEERQPPPASPPRGGAQNEGAPAETVNMYEALWTNGPSSALEFFDYTFKEHFGHALPVYMPREPLLKYMMSRVTKNCPDFFDKYMKFNTSVENVTFDETTSKFEVVTKNMLTGQTITDDYDKCIWAAGENGKPSMPGTMVNMFREGGFKGRIIHSSDTANFEEDVKGKRVLLIGGAYSGEDLALMAIKVGAEKVYVSTRDQDNVVSWTGAWPQNKVEVLLEQTPYRVTEDGSCIQFVETEWKFPNDYKFSETVETEVRDIDTVIFCTGYMTNLSMLDEKLRRPFTIDKEARFKVPADWKMEQNTLTEIVGDVEAGDVYWSNSLNPYHNLYHGLSISNPSMMFLTCDGQDNPIFAIDVNAWLLLRFITGVREIPSTEEMRKKNQDFALVQMQNPYLRYYMDGKYFEAIEEAWKKDPEGIDKLIDAYELDYEKVMYRYQARCIQEADYPVSFGTFDELNDFAKSLMKFGIMSYEHRTKLNPKNEKENQWRTFRDYKDARKFSSLHTGTGSCPLKQRWLEIDANDNALAP